MGKTRRNRPLRKRKSRRSTKRYRGGNSISIDRNLVPTSINHFKTNYVASKANGTQVIINGTSIAAIEPYFEGTSLNTTQKQELMDLLFKTFGVKDFYEIQKKVEEAILSLYPFTKPCSKREWKSCSGTCQTILADLIQKEIGSTAYMVRSLFRSVLWSNKKKNEPVPITLSFNGPLTGEWQKDIAIIKMELDYPNPKGRLIMGFGPSAAGKTYWAQTLINLFSKVEGFPTTFFSIDGGLYRETSMIYQMIIRTLMRTCTVGFENLVGSTIGVKSLFKSSDVKDAMMSFLLTHRPVSLYVPETLGTCGWPGAEAHLGSEPCINKYQEYIDLTQDKEWIGLHIWQHESGTKCTYSELQKCKGCSESGRSREIMEGKKYSSGAYGHSIDKSNKHMKEAKGGQFNIHNAGGRKTGNQFNKTTIYDLSENRAQNPFSKILAEHADQFNYIYSTDPVKP